MSAPARLREPGAAEGVLRCRGCGSTRDLAHGDVRYHMTRGWPRHRGHTMEWFTPAQIERGELPVAAGAAPPEPGGEQ